MLGSTRNVVAAFAAVLAALTGCAANEPRPNDELVRARTLIEQARQSGANQFASTEAQNAQDKLQRAEVAADKKQHAVARRLAVQASLDAELASARTRSGKAEAAAEEVQASVATLRQEAERRGKVQP